MSNIMVTINAPELVSALCTLVEALKGTSAPAPVMVVPPITMTPAPAAPMATPPPAMPTAPAAPAAAPIAPANAQQLVQQPVAQAASAVPAPVPTTTPTYTLEQLAVAATQLVDAGRRNELITLLGQFGVQALTALPKEQYGNFATALRQMGAQI